MARSVEIPVDADDEPDDRRRGSRDGRWDDGGAGPDRPRRPARWRVPVAVGATALVALAIGRWTAPTGATTGVATASGAAFVVVADPQVTVTAVPGTGIDVVVGQSSGLAWGLDGPVVFRGQGLSDDTTTAHAWRLGTVPGTAAADLARALGLDPTPTATDGQVVQYVGAPDRPSLRVIGGTTEPVTVELSIPGHCWDAPPPSATDGTGAPVPASGCSQPSDDQAVAAARSLLTALAVDLTGTTASASSQSGDTVVRFDRGSDGTGGWTVDYGSSSTTEASGVLTPMADMGSYPVISPAAGVARLGSTGYDAVDESDSTLASHSVWPSPSADPGAPIRLPAKQVDVVGADLVLRVYRLADGGSALLPAYRYSTADGSFWSVIAVADASLVLGDG